MYSSDEACAEKQLVSRPLRAPKKMHVRKKKKRTKIIVPWASEWNDRERPFIQSHEIKLQKIDFENFYNKTKVKTSKMNKK